MGLLRTWRALGVAGAVLALTMASPTPAAEPQGGFGPAAWRDGWKPYGWVSLKPGTDTFRSRLGLFVPMYATPESIFFLDLRGVRGYRGGLEANVGAGIRRRVGERFVLGGALYWDRLHTHHQNELDQVTLALELLSDTWDVRLNGYWPLDGRKKADYDPIAPRISGHRILLQDPYSYEKSLRGIELEVGRRLPLPEWLPETRAYLAAYHFDRSDVPSADGGRLRIEARPLSWMTVGLEGQHDSLRHWQGFLEVRFTFPPRRDRTPERGVAGRMMDIVVRDVDVVSSDEAKRPEDPLRDVRGNPVDVFFVDNSRGDRGEGTFEEPFQRLADAESAAGRGDWIYVYRGDGSTRHQDRGIRLKDRQKLFGQGHPLMVDGFTLIPGGRFPRLTGPERDLPEVEGPPNPDTLGAAVHLADGNEVAGLHLIGANVGILGSGIRDFDIHHNVLSGSSVGGAGLFDVSGTGFLRDNRIYGHDMVGGAVVQFSDVSLDFMMSGNRIWDVNASDDDGCCGMFIGAFAGGGRIRAEVYDNHISDSSQGLNMQISGNARLEAHVHHNRIDDGTEVGFGLEASDNARAFIRVHDNIIRGDEAGMGFFAEGNARVRYHAWDNTLSGEDEVAFGMGLEEMAQGSLIFENNELLGDFGAQASENSELCVGLRGNVATGDFDVGQSDAATVQLEADSASNVPMPTTSGVVAAVPVGTCPKP